MSTSELPALPENEKTYAGIPEAVFVVSIMNHFELTSKMLSNSKLKKKKIMIFSFAIS